MDLNESLYQDCMATKTKTKEDEHKDIDKKDTRKDLTVRRMIELLFNRPISKP